ncbi:MAG: hypothetical protein HKN22_01130, partial [Bacteroidia bacterium]|nr:hypothetical protein [Bacteroidia bacterium]
MVADRFSTTWIRIILFNLVAAALTGVSLRYAFVTDMQWFNYKNTLHAHSHLAMLGWIQSALLLLIVKFFDLDVKRYSSAFIFLQIAIAAMFISFLFMGYGVSSIGFLIIHMLVTYYIIIKMWKDASNTITGSRTSSNSVSVIFLKTAFVFFILSTTSIWAIGPIIMSSMKGTALYYA